MQAEAFAAADRQVTEWGIEHNERGERADAYLYCVEVKPEGCDYFIPLAPSWLIGEKSKVVARWQRVPGSDRLQPEIAVVSDAELKLYKEKKGATVVDSRVIDPFDANRSWSVEALRGPEGLRRWTNDDLVPRPGDVFQERLYCIRWINARGQTAGYAAPDAADLAREAKVLALLRERFADWQREGFIPSKAIPEGGDKTEEPIPRARLDPLASPLHAAAVADAWAACGDSDRLAQSKAAKVGVLAWDWAEWQIGIPDLCRWMSHKRQMQKGRSDVFTIKR